MFSFCIKVFLILSVLVFTTSTACSKEGLKSCIKEFKPYLTKKPSNGVLSRICPLVIKAYNCYNAQKVGCSFLKKIVAKGVKKSLGIVEDYCKDLDDPSVPVFKCTKETITSCTKPFMPYLDGTGKPKSDKLPIICPLVKSASDCHSKLSECSLVWKPVVALVGKTLNVIKPLCNGPNPATTTTLRPCKPESLDNCSGLLLSHDHPYVNQTEEMKCETIEKADKCLKAIQNGCSIGSMESDVKEFRKTIDDEKANLTCPPDHGIALQPTVLLLCLSSLGLTLKHYIL